MDQIARCHWLPERARWLHLARSGLPAVSRKQNFVRSRWLDIGLVLFFASLFVSVHKHAKKELGQYPAILTSHLVSDPYVSVCSVCYSYVTRMYSCGVLVMIVSAVSGTEVAFNIKQAKAGWLHSFLSFLPETSKLQSAVYSEWK